MYQVNAGSVKATILAIRNVNVTKEQAGREAVEAAGEVWKTAVKKNASRSDHSLARLAALGHPYGKRSNPGGINTGALGAPFRKRPYLIHKRSGGFTSAIKGKIVTGTSGVAYRLQVQASSPYQRYVVEGTSIMWPRDILWRTGNEPAVMKKMKVAIIRTLGKKLRTQAVIRL